MCHRLRYVAYGTQMKEGNEMKIKVYDYDNRATKIDIPDDKEISAIVVCVLSGDETGIIRFTDGTTIRFDASDSRTWSFYDGLYVVTGEDIQKWIKFNAKKHASDDIPEARQNAFSDEESFF